MSKKTTKDKSSVELVKMTRTPKIGEDGKPIVKTFTRKSKDGKEKEVTRHSYVPFDSAVGPEGWVWNRLHRVYSDGRKVVSPNLLECGTEVPLGEDFADPLDYVLWCINVAHPSLGEILVKERDRMATIPKEERIAKAARRRAKAEGFLEKLSGKLSEDNQAALSALQAQIATCDDPSQLPVLFQQMGLLMAQSLGK